MSKKFIFLVILAVFLFSSVILMQVGNIGTTTLWNISDQGKWLLPLVGVSALIDSINPCAFSILILTIAFLLSIGRLRANILRIGGFYIFGIFLVYILIGFGVIQALHIFNTPHFIGKIGAILLIILGVINILGQIFPKFPIRLKIPGVSHGKMADLMEKASLPTAFLLGTLVGLCEFPCTGGPYLMVLGLLHDKATYVQGIGYLFLYNLIFILPLVIILFIASDKGLLGKIEKLQMENRSSIRYFSGIAAIILGVIIYNI